MRPKCLLYMAGARGKAGKFWWW